MPRKKMAKSAQKAVKPVIDEELPEVEDENSEDEGQGETPEEEQNEKPPVSLSRKVKVGLYAAQRALIKPVREFAGLLMPVPVYFKDPEVARRFPDLGIDRKFTTPWEPGLRHGPTSARFAVVDYDATKNSLTPPALWNRKLNQFTAPDKTALDAERTSVPQFHQVSVWATIQNTLDYFESGMGLGRRITWAFEGNRLIVLPHAGYGENAFYDRGSKSLQFYYFNGPKETCYTCLSSDIVNHEFGHAVLDGLRPHFYESLAGETGGFHEFLGDLTAILMSFRNNKFRQLVLKHCDGDLDNDRVLANLAAEFGQALMGADCLRSGVNDKTMKKVANKSEPHELSEVLTGAMFDLLKGLYKSLLKKEKKNYAAGLTKLKPSERRALWNTVPLMQTMAIQPLDLLPPCAVTFRDYALAVLRSEQVANPTDPSGYRAMMLDIFIKRGILLAKDKAELLKPERVFSRPDLTVSHPIESIAASRGGAYRFLDDNRAKLLIPLNADLIVSEVVRASKQALDGRRLPDQIIVQYTWREEVLLDDPRFGQFAGQRTSMLCGATLVLDENGNQIHWARKPGSAPLEKDRNRDAEQKTGQERLKQFLESLAQRVAAGAVGSVLGSEMGLVERVIPPYGVSNVGGELRFERAPHFALNHNHDADETGDRQWQISF